VTPKQFRKFLDRDGGCIHCGETDAVAPHHRLNRGMGGSKSRDTASNIVVLCSTMNNLVESNADVAERARENGWKLRNGQNPRTTPIWLPRLGFWALLNDDYDVTNIRRETNANYSPETRL
jgi:hypothetical protein